MSWKSFLPDFHLPAVKSSPPEMRRSLLDALSERIKRFATAFSFLISEVSYGRFACNNSINFDASDPRSSSGKLKWRHYTRHLDEYFMQKTGSAFVSADRSALRRKGSGEIEMADDTRYLDEYFMQKTGSALFLPIAEPSGGKDLGSELWPLRVQQQRKFRRFRPRVPAQGKLKWRATRATLMNILCKKTGSAFVSADRSALRRKGANDPGIFFTTRFNLSVLFGNLSDLGSELWPFRVQQQRKFRRFRPRVPAQRKLKWRTARATLMNILCKRRGRLLFLPIGAPSGGKGSELWPFRVQQQRKFRRFRPRVPAQGKLKWRTARATLMNILCKRRGRLLFLPIGAPSGGKGIDLFMSLEARSLCGMN
ncbi:hypothetical protein CEXT_707771 [Caerostris extrusa]|uniref:Uncharacterized protein n=1 Tax=Caerostris extrusa TaxID=172846 RepID=A0AAV4PC34_CAEEX|nr:hypothetical protein CEXT_707771 [Caerostris extrusa]